MALNRPYHHGDLRRSLLDEAAALLREEGEAGLSMRALAARAGVSRTAPYHHFRDKQELLCAIAEEGFRRFASVPAIDAAHLDEARLGRFVRDYLDFALTNTEYYDLMFGGHLWKTATITDALRDEAHGCFRSYVEQIRRWQEAGAITADVDVLRYAQVSWGTLHGLCRLLIDGIYLDRASMGRMCDEAARMFWRELSAG